MGMRHIYDVLVLWSGPTERMLCTNPRSVHVQCREISAASDVWFIVCICLVGCARPAFIASVSTVTVVGNQTTTFLPVKGTHQAFTLLPDFHISSYTERMHIYR